MSYTNVWSTTRPLDTLAANQLGNEIRTFRLDIQERLNTLVNDSTVDPIVPNDLLTGKQTGKLTNYSPYAIIAASPAPDYGNGFVTIPLGANSAFPLILPTGVTVTQVQVDINTSGSVTANFKKILVVGASRTVTLIASGTSGTTLIAMAGLTELTAANTFYWVYLNGTQAYDVYGVIVTYNTPDSRNTI